jgi:hypothetical protein
LPTQPDGHEGELSVTNPTTFSFDWREVARLALASRLMDEMEEGELTPEGLVT